MYHFFVRFRIQNQTAKMPELSLRSLQNIVKPLVVMGKQNYLQLSTANIIRTPMAEIRTTTAEANAVVNRSETMPLLEIKEPALSREIFDVSEAESIPKVVMERSPLSFAEIPGPAILKLWEKYWRYVPALGTQLFVSVLINSFTEGRLSWNRNITPLKYLFNEYGPVVRINGPMMNDVVMIHRPDHIAEVLKQEGDCPMRSGIDVLQHYHLHYRKYRLPGPFSMQGSEWLETKAKLEKPFAQQLSRYFSRLEMICDEFCQRVRKIRNRQDEVPGSFDKELSRWGMECFSVLIFNKRLGFLDPTGYDSSSEPTKILDALMSAHLYMSRCETGFQVWRFLETPFSRRLFEACDVIEGCLLTPVVLPLVILMIFERILQLAVFTYSPTVIVRFTGKFIRQAQNQLSMKSVTSYDEVNNFEDGSPILQKLLMNQKMQPDDISSLLMDMIVLGVQATANTQAFLLYFLAKNPRIQRKINEEISWALPTIGSSLVEESLEQMTYLKACLRECLRLRPAFPYISRLLPKTITLHGYEIPKGTYLIMANQISSQREENFEDPEKFRPERWLVEQSDDDIWQKYSCLPFGHGARSCLGKNIAEKQILLLTAKLVREFKIEYDYANIESKYLMVNVPNRPLRFRFVGKD